MCALTTTYSQHNVPKAGLLCLSLIPYKAIMLSFLQLLPLKKAEGLDVRKWIFSMEITILPKAQCWHPYQEGLTKLGV